MLTFIFLAFVLLDKLQSNNFYLLGVTFKNFRGSFPQRFFNTSFLGRGWGIRQNMLGYIVSIYNITQGLLTAGQFASPKVTRTLAFFALVLLFVLTLLLLFWFSSVSFSPVAHMRSLNFVAIVPSVLNKLAN